MYCPCFPSSTHYQSFTLILYPLGHFHFSSTHCPNPAPLQPFTPLLCPLTAHSRFSLLTYCLSYPLSTNLQLLTHFLYLLTVFYPLPYPPTILLPPYGASSPCRTVITVLYLPVLPLTSSSPPYLFPILLHSFLAPSFLLRSFFGLFRVIITLLISFQIPFTFPLHFCSLFHPSFSVPYCSPPNSCKGRKMQLRTHSTLPVIFEFVYKLVSEVPLSF